MTWYNGSKAILDSSLGQTWKQDKMVVFNKTYDTEHEHRTSDHEILNLSSLGFLHFLSQIKSHGWLWVRDRGWMASLMAVCSARQRSEPTRGRQRSQVTTHKTLAPSLLYSGSRMGIVRGQCEIWFVPGARTRKYSASPQTSADTPPTWRLLLRKSHFRSSFRLWIHFRWE